MRKERVAIGLLAAYGLAWTLAAGAWVARKGGPRYAMEQLGLARHRHVARPFQAGMLARFRAWPHRPGALVFAGDSITAGMPAAEYFADVRVRGIGGDTSDGLLGRVDELVLGPPRQVILNVGTNDLSREVPAAEVAGNVRRAVALIRSAAPGADVAVVSVLPVGPGSGPGVRSERKAAEVWRLNRLLAAGAASAGYRFADVAPRFSDARGHLRPELTTDGTHLSDAGYRAYCEALAPHVMAR